MFFSSSANYDLAANPGHEVAECRIWHGLRLIEGAKHAAIVLIC